MNKNSKRTGKSKMKLNILALGIVTCGIGWMAAFVPGHPGDEWKAPATVKDKKNPVEANDASLAAGKKAYEKECLSCHGKKGKGDGPNAATLEKPAGDLTSEKIQEQTDGELFWKITEGRKPMPSTKKVFTEEQRWQLVHYIRTFKKVKK